MTQEHTVPEVSGKERFDFKVNGERFSTSDQLESGHDIRRKAGLNPSSDYVLIQLMRPGARSIGLDEKVDFGEPGREEFRAFLSDRIFTFTVDEVGCEWGEPSISESAIRDIADIPNNKALVLERKDEPDHVIEDGASIDLSARGTEHIRTKKRVIIVTYGDDDKTFTFEPGNYTGAQLAERFGVPANYVLDLIVNGKFEEIAPDRVLHLKNGMHFISQPGKGSSS